MLEYVNKLMVFVSWAHAAEIKTLTGQKLIAHTQKVKEESKSDRGTDAPANAVAHTRIRTGTTVAEC